MGRVSVVGARVELQGGPGSRPPSPSSHRTQRQGREEAQLCAGRFAGPAHGRAIVAAEIVHDHRVAGAERRHQHMPGIGEAALAVDRPVEDRWGVDPGEPEPGINVGKRRARSVKWCASARAASGSAGARPSAPGRGGASIALKTRCLSSRWRGPVIKAWLLTSLHDDACPDAKGRPPHRSRMSGTRSGIGSGNSASCSRAGSWQMSGEALRVRR